MDKICAGMKHDQMRQLSECLHVAWTFEPWLHITLVVMVVYNTLCLLT